MAEPTTAYIGLGSNLGDRKQLFAQALEMLAQSEQIEVTRTSDHIETVALAGDDQPGYLNTVAEIKTTLTAEQLHKKTSDIEAGLGRVRRVKWSPRTIDLDLLLFGDRIIDRPNLTVPHPHMHLRTFALDGLSQLSPDLQHPVLKESLGTLAARLGGANFVPDPNLPQIISIAGVIGVGKTTMAKGLSCLVNGECIFEPYDDNPFLPEVYAGKKELALDSQLYFLTERAKQLSCDTLAPGKITLTDYVFEKELIYARQLLSKSQLDLYKTIYEPFSSRISSPVVVVYLTDSPDSCLDRIHTRNRPYEQKIEPEFLKNLSDDYDKMFADWKTCPVIRISTKDFDSTRQADIEHLAAQIKAYVAV